MKRFFAEKFNNIILAFSAVVTSSYFIVEVLGQTIPNTIMSFFKDIGVMIVVTAVFVFAFIWLVKSRPSNKPKNYSIITYDVYGKESNIDGIRIKFKNHDVAWSFMKQYKKFYPLYNFALVSSNPTSNKKTIFRYI